MSCPDLLDLVFLLELLTLSAVVLVAVVAAVHLAVARPARRDTDRAAVTGELRRAARRRVWNIIINIIIIVYC